MEQPKKGLTPLQISLIVVAALAGGYGIYTVVKKVTPEEGDHADDFIKDEPTAATGESSDDTTNTADDAPTPTKSASDIGKPILSSTEATLLANYRAGKYNSNLKTTIGAYYGKKTSSDLVKIVQYILLKKGYKIGKADGILGKNTLAALAKANNYSADAIKKVTIGGIIVKMATGASSTKPEATNSTYNVQITD